jgi:hypothetical protein
MSWKGRRGISEASVDVERLGGNKGKGNREGGAGEKVN